MNFARFAFTDGVKKLQEKYGSRSSYARMESLMADKDGITEPEQMFIESRDSFYMASIAKTAIHIFSTGEGRPVLLK